MHDNCGEAHRDRDMNMEIDLRKTKTVCISMKKAEQRRQNVTNLLNTLGYERWSFYDGIVGKDAIEGCALSHIDVLSSHDFKEPLLLVEDDIVDSSFYNPIISCPDDTDAFYVGYSWWAWTEERASQSTLPHMTQAKYENSVYRISCMLSTHAILYINGDYAKAAIKAMKDYLLDQNGNRHCDVAVAKIQQNYKVYAPGKHLFFQMCPQNTFWTNRGIDSYEVLETQSNSMSLLDFSKQ